jgi:hypothetical protein
MHVQFCPKWGFPRNISALSQALIECFASFFNVSQPLIECFASSYWMFCKLFLMFHKLFLNVSQALIKCFASSYWMFHKFFLMFRKLILNISQAFIECFVSSNKCFASSYWMFRKFFWAFFQPQELFRKLVRSNGTQTKVHPHPTASRYDPPFSADTHNEPCTDNLENFQYSLLFNPIDWYID